MGYLSFAYKQTSKVYQTFFTKLKLYKSKEIESTLLEIIKNNQKNVVVGCIYKHPCVANQEFTNDFICPLLEKLLTEKKKVILISNYNTIILNSDVDHQTSDSLDTMYSHSFFPAINTPTRISTTSTILVIIFWQFLII